MKKEICNHPDCLDYYKFKSIDGNNYCRYHWWGVHKLNKEPVYLYKDYTAAQNQANRDSAWVVSPFYVVEQTPYTQKINIEGKLFKWSTITIVMFLCFLLGCLIRIFEI